jgi:ribosome biogenesis protein Tsr3
VLHIENYQDNRKKTMDKKLAKGGLIKKPKKDDQILTVLLSGESYASRDVVKKYSPKFLRKLNETGKIIVVEDEKTP